MGQAVQKAAEAARLRVLLFAATALGVPLECVEFQDGLVIATPPDGSGEPERVPLAPLVMGFYGGTGYEFTGEGSSRQPARAGRRWILRVCPGSTGWGAAEVSVDADTGVVTVHRLVVSGDAGTVLHEGACRGQDEGAAIMGLGGALFETMRFDGAVLANGRLVDYRVPAIERSARRIRLDHAGTGARPRSVRLERARRGGHASGRVGHRQCDRGCDRGEGHLDAIDRRNGACRTRRCPGATMSAASGAGWAITHVRHIALNCSAFDECLDYYAGPWGLERLSDSDEQQAVLRATGPEHHVLELHRSDSNSIDHLSLRARR